jgi:hypothetical protein
VRSVRRPRVAHRGATKVRVRFVVGEDVDKRRDPCSPHLRRRSCLARETSPNSCFQSSTAHLTKSVASRYGSRGIRCNAAAPGLVLTPRLEHRYTTPGQLEVALATPGSRSRTARSSNTRRLQRTSASQWAMRMDDASTTGPGPGIPVPVPEPPGTPDLIPEPVPESDPQPPEVQPSPDPQIPPDPRPPELPTPDPPLDA